MSARLELNPSKFESNIYAIEYLFEAGVADNAGLVIPDYQRRYTWAEEDILRILVDLMKSVRLRENMPASNFFGATVWCKRNRVNEPEFSLPSFDIVDGQQRISTIMLLILSCAFTIFRTHKYLQYSSPLPSNLNTWLTSQIELIRHRVDNSTVGILRRAEIEFPRIINENDIRGRTKATSDFVSPISQVQMKFYKALEDGETEIDFSSLRIKERDRDVFERLKNNFEIFNDHIERIADQSFWDRHNVELTERHKLKNKHLKDLLQSDSFPESEFDKTVNKNELFEKLIRVMQLYGQLTKASCFSIISCNDEDTAFAIFDSLNTTGVPLTAIETLKPQLMRSYRDKGYTFDDSQADKNLRKVEEVINAPGNSQEQQITLSKELVIHSILLGKGDVVSNNLNHQRTKMREMHSKCAEAGELDLCSTILRNIVEYREEFSFVNNIRAFSSPTLTPSEIDEVKLINTFLTNSGTKLHRPVKPPLSVPILRS